MGVINTGSHFVGNVHRSEAMTQKQTATTRAGSVMPSRKKLREITLGIDRSDKGRRDCMCFGL